MTSLTVSYELKHVKNLLHSTYRVTGRTQDATIKMIKNTIFSSLLLRCTIQLTQQLYYHMMTSSNGNIFRGTGPLWGEFTGHLRIPLTKASDPGVDVFFNLRLNKQLSKQSWGWCFGTPSRPLRRHCNESARNPWAPCYVQARCWWVSELDRNVGIRMFRTFYRNG